MPLPFYKNSQIPFYGEPIYLNLFEVRFNNSYLEKYLTNSCYKLKNKHIYFHINDINNNDNSNISFINVISFFNDNIKNKTKSEVDIFLYKKDGEILSIITLEDFRFIKINILKFSNTKANILKLKIRFKYKKMIFYKNVTSYTRIKKLKNLNEK